MINLLEKVMAAVKTFKGELNVAGRVKPIFPEEVEVVLFASAERSLRATLTLSGADLNALDDDWYRAMAAVYDSDPFILHPSKIAVDGDRVPKEAIIATSMEKGSTHVVMFSVEDDPCVYSGVIDIRTFDERPTRRARRATALSM